ncbi:MAG: hypothetical protein HW386_2322 [Gammaproteobacteria bacterium]|nr:hypothetical protein [Gammaproteobacteria bacterium]
MNSYIRALAVSLLMIPVLAIIGATQTNAVTLEVMNPSGEIPPPPFHAPSSRISNLDGKKVGIYWIGKAGGDNFWNGVEELLNERFPKVQTVRYEGPFDLGDARAAELAREVDTMFYGVGD